MAENLQEFILDTVLLGKEILFMFDTFQCVTSKMTDKDTKLEDTIVIKADAHFLQGDRLLGALEFKRERLNKSVRTYKLKNG